MDISIIRQRTQAGWPHGPVASRFSCKCFSIFLVTPISLAVAPSYWALSFHLISRGHSWPEIRPTFWQRWHITLSTWVRDYLFMPFSRGRKGHFVLSRNLMIVMILVGLWHGANWTFVAWGAYHGILLIGYRVFDRAAEGTTIAKIMKKALLRAF